MLGYVRLGYNWGALVFKHYWRKKLKNFRIKVRGIRVGL